jgi:hypothetical protein
MIDIRSSAQRGADTLGSHQRFLIRDNLQETPGSWLAGKRASPDSLSIWQRVNYHHACRLSAGII